MIERGDLERPAILDHDRLVRLDDEAWAGGAGAGADVGATVDRRLTPFSAREETCLLGGSGSGGVDSMGRLGGFRTAADSFDLVGLEDYLSVLEDEAELLAMKRFEHLRHFRNGRNRDSKGRVGALVAQMRAMDDVGIGLGHALRSHLLENAGGQFVTDRRQRIQGLAERDGNRLLAGSADVRKSHAIGGQDAGEGVDHDGRNAERIGRQAGMLAAGTAEAGQHVIGDVIAALDTDFLHRIRHVLDGDRQEAVCDFFRRTPVADGRGHVLEGCANGRCVQRLVAVRAEDLREEFGRELAEHDIGVGDGERPAAAIGFRPGIGAGGIRPDAEAPVLEVEDGAAARGNGVDGHHRRAHPNTGNFRLEGPLQLAIVVGDVRRRAAHVEADHAVKPGEP
nr:hypothetical protein RFYW14_00002 [Pseudorhizobium flavum]